MGKLSAKAMAVQKDIEKIDMVLSTKDSNAYKSLHIELDRTYQNLIKNWGTQRLWIFRQNGLHL